MPTKPQIDINKILSWVCVKQMEETEVFNVKNKGPWKGKIAVY